MVSIILIQHPERKTSTESVSTNTQTEDSRLLSDITKNRARVPWSFAVALTAYSSSSERSPGRRKETSPARRAFPHVKLNLEPITLDDIAKEAVGLMLMM
jgi:hypothetical protein